MAGGGECGAVVWISLLDEWYVCRAAVVVLVNLFGTFSSCS